MPFTIVRNDITRMEVDAIVNSAAPHLLGGGGADGAIHRVAGPELTKACRALGGCKTGQVKLTKGYGLPCRYVIHTVGPVWLGGIVGEEEKLRACYRNALALAKEHGFESIAFPLISSGIFAMPRELAIRVATEEIGAFVLANDLMVYLVVYDPESFRISSQLQKDIRQYIDDRYVAKQQCREDTFFAGGMETSASLWADSFFDDAQMSEEPAFFCDQPSVSSERADLPAMEQDELFAMPPSEEWLAGSPEGFSDAPAQSGPVYSAAAFPDEADFDWLEDTLEFPPVSPQGAMEPQAAAPMAAPPAASPVYAQARASAPVTEEEHEEQLRRLLQMRDESFTQMLLRMIDEKGMTDPECYRRANIDRRLFSKIRNNLHYKPSKQTALAFAVALRMDLAETEAFLRTAGLALSPSSKFDIIVEYCLTHNLYDIHQINRILYDFDQITLGA